jgi:hypothetical protein
VILGTRGADMEPYASSNGDTESLTQLHSLTGLLSGEWRLRLCTALLAQ